MLDVSSCIYHKLVATWTMLEAGNQIIYSEIFVRLALKDVHRCGLLWSEWHFSARASYARNGTVTIFN